MSLVLMYRNIAISCSYSDIRIGGRNIAAHRLCIVEALVLILLISCLFRGRVLSVDLH